MLDHIAQRAPIEGAAGYRAPAIRDRFWKVAKLPGLSDEFVRRQSLSEVFEFPATPDLGLHDRIELKRWKSHEDWFDLVV